jgi:glycosyltransferase involved in cell wall biosynthesis
MSLSLKEVPSLYKKAGVIYRRLIVPRAIKKADRIITISQFAKNEICSYYPASQNKIEVVYNSADINIKGLNEKAEKAFFEDNDISSPYILGFGSLETRKNSMGLIKAYCELSNDIKLRYQLVLFGFRGYEESEEFRYIKKNSVKNVIVLGYISDEEKTTLYKKSSMFVFPTFSEGFGIPVLEAFSNSTPVITSNVTAVPEVAGDAAILVDPSNINMISKAIERLIVENELAQLLIEKGKLQLQKFDWRRTSERMINLIKAVKGEK